ncbi:hypothetical protein CPB84DRAFT_1723508 [Gymnopilus junonius]|uniref:Uncharacterized protein n=1 Tax=Gymnopilus junonius TaxID=109634 RepID=A0A9P5NV77_GYMJU|nr:hypothetical protein CPB84DRAFT_1723508 [Gymnopilus junonius]
MRGCWLRRRNNLQHPLVPGKANIFVDGVFTSALYFPGLSPNETFDCPLGNDPSIQIIYHPRKEKIYDPKSDLYTKSTTATYAQCIMIYNSKPVPIDELTVIGQIPVFEDPQVSIILKSPELTIVYLERLKQHLQ